MKNKKIKPPQIEWEDIGPAEAAAYLKKNVSNRTVRKGTVAAYARDMKLGNWIPTHQGIAFNDRKELIDGQHRLHAISESGVTVRMLVTRGIPAETGAMRTMDVVDRGAVRSVADQLELQHGFRNAKQVASCGSVIAELTLNKWVGRITVPQMLKILEIYGRHIDPVVELFNASHINAFRRACTNAPLALARAVAPQRVDDFCDQLKSGAGLSADSPVLLLRNYLLTQGDSSTQEKRDLAKLTLNCVHRFVENEPMTKVNFNPGGLRYFAERQKDHLETMAEVFQGKISSFNETSRPERELAPPAAAAPARVVTAENWKPNAAVDALLRYKDISDRNHNGTRGRKMQDRIARGEIAGAIK
jgi:hypothetical protein